MTRSLIEFQVIPLQVTLSLIDSEFITGGSGQGVGDLSVRMCTNTVVLSSSSFEAVQNPDEITQHFPVFFSVLL